MCPLCARGDKGSWKRPPARSEGGGRATGTKARVLRAATGDVDAMAAQLFPARRTHWLADAALTSFVSRCTRMLSSSTRIEKSELKNFSSPSLPLRASRTASSVAAIPRFPLRNQTRGQCLPSGRE